MKKSTTLLFLILAVLIVACTQSDKQQAEALQVETINAITNKIKVLPKLSRNLKKHPPHH